MQTNIIGILVVIVVVVIIVVLFYRQSGRPKPTELHYFLPGEVVFRIRHSPTIPPSELEPIPPDPEQTKAQIVAAIRGFLGPNDKSPQEASANVTQPASRGWIDMLEMPEGATSNVITLPFTNEGAPGVSLVRVPVKGYDAEKNMDTQAVRSILRDAYADLKQNNLIPLANGYNIEDFSLNWLIGNLHHGGATGGPGGRPVPAQEPQPNQLGFRVVSPTTNLFNTITTPRQITTYVAILDTAPTAAAIADAYHNKWPNHPVLQRLFGTKLIPGKLTIHYASPATLYSMEHFGLPLHDYLMPDHGTFIAGIINSGAPDANLHLYEVLSRYGVGTFTSIAQGISDARRDLDRPLIMNCSFQFCLPDGDYGPNLVADLGVTMADLQKSMRELFEELVTDPQIMVVASAGNDSTIQSRVDARYPAAFNNVIGVGALPIDHPQDSNNNFVPATYSNLADNPPGNGFMTLGGESGTGQGIRGLYISSFPGILPLNLTGWAWWAGTSFAAAVISGLLAAEVSGNSGFLSPVTPVSPGQTSRGEPVIVIDQG